jgi:hypothetical protein
VTTIEIAAYKELVGQLIKFQENQVLILQKLADLVPKEEPAATSVVVGPGTLQFDAVQDAQISAKEATIFGEEFSEEEMARQFNEPPPVRLPTKPLKEMTKAEIEALESSADNSNDLYKIKARVANLARFGGASLTAQGEMLANTYVHVLKAFYDFAETIPDKTIRNNLVSLIRKHEDMPANLIAAAGAGVNQRPGPKR